MWTWDARKNAHSIHILCLYCPTLAVWFDVSIWQGYQKWKKSALPSKNLNIYTVFHPYIYIASQNTKLNLLKYTVHVLQQEQKWVFRQTGRGKKNQEQTLKQEITSHFSTHIKICKRVKRFAWTHFENLSLGTLILAYLVKRKAQLGDSCNCSVTHLNHTEHHHPKSSPTLS